MGSWEELRGLLLGHRVSAAIAAAVQLGLVDLLAGQPRTADDLADAAGTDSDATGRLLRALVTVNLIAEDDGRFSLTELGALLRSDAPLSLRPQALLQADPAVWDAWGYLAHSVRTGETGFIAKHGIDVWAHRAAQPEHNANFNALMTSLSGTVADAVAASFDFSRLAHVVDVGGGHGALLAAVLRAHPRLTGTVFDQDHAVAQE
ncbi:MAG: methyltransferase, partial [Gaiella sp.]|uniref:methyltransferase n=1 Tax=Gaiella sp. TaxID=2663207 RepID=UPI003C75E8E8